MYRALLMEVSEAGQSTWFRQSTPRKWLNARNNCAVRPLYFFPLCVFPPWRVAGNSFITRGIYLSPHKCQTAAVTSWLLRRRAVRQEIIPWAYRANTLMCGRGDRAHAHTHKQTHAHKHTCKHIASTSVSATVSSSHHFHIYALPPPSPPPPLPQRTFSSPYPSPTTILMQCPPPCDVVAGPWQ